jgi:TPR repeat protein
MKPSAFLHLLLCGLLLGNQLLIALPSMAITDAELLGENATPTSLVSQASTPKLAPASSSKNGTTTTSDKELALYFKQKSLGSTRDIDFNIGKVYEKQKNYIKALQYYELSSPNSDYSPANERLGVFYLLGLGTPKNYAKATDYLHNAIASKDGQNLTEPNQCLFAKYYLGLVYLQGLGVKQDGAKANAWFRIVKKSIQNGTPAETEPAYLDFINQGLYKNIQHSLLLMKQQKTSISTADQYVASYYDYANTSYYAVYGKHKGSIDWVLSEQQKSTRRAYEVKNSQKEAKENILFAVTAPVWIIPYLLLVLRGKKGLI